MVRSTTTTLAMSFGAIVCNIAFVVVSIALISTGSIIYVEDNLERTCVEVLCVHMDHLAPNTCKVVGCPSKVYTLVRRTDAPNNPVSVYVSSSNACEFNCQDRKRFADVVGVALICVGCLFLLNVLLWSFGSWLCGGTERPRVRVAPEIVIIPTRASTPPASPTNVQFHLDNHIKVFEGDNKNDLNDSCAICLGSFDNTLSTDLVTTHKCKHVYHKACIQQWLKTKLSCPLCGVDV